MEMDNAQLSDLETYASLMFTKNEIAVIMEMDPHDLSDKIGDPQSPAGKAFQRGRLKREAELRKGIFDLAQNGSSPAQTLALKLVENAKAEDL